MVSSLLGNKATPSDPIIMLKLLLEAMETLYSIPVSQKICADDVMVYNYGRGWRESGERD